MKIGEFMPGKMDADDWGSAPWGDSSGCHLSKFKHGHPHSQQPYCKTVTICRVFNSSPVYRGSELTKKPSQWLQEKPEVAKITCFFKISTFNFFFLISTFLISFFFFLRLKCEAWGILIPWLGVKPVSPAMEVQNPNNWTSREFPDYILTISTPGFYSRYHFGNQK